MGRRVLRRHTWGYSVCLCSIKGTPGVNELNCIVIVKIMTDILLNADDRDKILTVSTVKQPSEHTLKRDAGWRTEQIY